MGTVATAVGERFFVRLEEGYLVIGPSTLGGRLTGGLRKGFAMYRDPGLLADAMSGFQREDMIDAFSDDAELVSMLLATLKEERVGEGDAPSEDYSEEKAIELQSEAGALDRLKGNEKVVELIDLLSKNRRAAAAALRAHRGPLVDALKRKSRLLEIFLSEYLGLEELAEIEFSIDGTGGGELTVHWGRRGKSAIQFTADGADDFDQLVSRLEETELVDVTRGEVPPS